MKWMTKTSMIVAFAFVALASLSSVSQCLAVTAQAAVKPSKAKLSTLNSLQVSGEGDTAELVFKLSSPATYTSYKTTAPLRLVLDLSQTTQGNITSPIAINKGNFKSVTVSRFDTDAGVLTRVYIELEKDIEASISTSKENPGEMKISFPASVSGQSKTIGSAVPAPAVTAKVESPAASVQSKPSRTVSGVSVKDGSILISVSGGVSDFNSFKLNKPERFVIDITDATCSLSSKIVPLNVAGVASARVGLYPDKVRIVLDSVDGVFPEAFSKATQDGIIVTLKAKQADVQTAKLVTVQAAKSVTPQEAVQEKQKEVTKEVTKEISRSAKADSLPAKTAKPAKVSTVNPAVEMIDFQVVENISRVAVKITGDAVVEPPVKSPGFVTVTIKNADLPKQLQRSLETQTFVTPVLRVTPLVVKNKKGTDIKIRIAMRSPAVHSFRQEGDMLYVDFTNPAGLTAEKSSVELMDNKNKNVKPVKQPVVESDINNELVSPVESVYKPVGASKVYKGRKVTLEFADAEVRKIFQLLSEVSGKNFVLGDEVTGTISLKLVNVPWDQALDIIMDTKNLDMRDNGNVLTIKGKGKFKTQEEEAQELKKIQTKSIELKSATFDINYSDAGNIVTQITSLKTERGAITVDARTNKVIVKDIPQVIDDMRRLIAQLDVPEKQVMIEARIVEATSTFVQNFGVNWGFHYTDPINPFWGINGAHAGFGGLASTPPPATGVNGQPGGTMGISFGSIFGSSASIDVRLNAAASAGLIKIVSTPKVATLNNKTAKITQGQQVPYTSSTSDKVETKFVEAALSLEVTPHINANGTISMKIDAKNDSVGQSTGGSTAPAINKKQATTEMLLRDGETTVIGGIYVDSDNDSDDGVPYLMDIPLLGKLFKSSNKSKIKTELLIFITPKILTQI